LLVPLLFTEPFLIRQHVFSLQLTTTHSNIAKQCHTDIITLTSSSVPGAILDETEISYASERSQKFFQVKGFQSQQVSSGSTDCAAANLPAGCKSYKDPKTGLSHLFYYPNDDTVQYLYETYPKQISPLVGIQDEHFIVWMRTQSLPKFRKLYGRISENFSKNDVITFQVEANFEVRSFNANKAIIITNNAQFGAKNGALGIAYVTVGSLSLFLGIAFCVKQVFVPRQLGNPKKLGWTK
jgi:LEM3 (ligand-effect modulator 3) family / CDC50 family